MRRGGKRRGGERDDRGNVDGKGSGLSAARIPRSRRRSAPAPQPAAGPARRASCGCAWTPWRGAVSYTHLTLPTILLV
eukprot:6435268-Pyramimonas_sp.AAC.1